MNNEPTESRMLEQVRRWRRAAYEADQSASASERLAKTRELAERYGLNIISRQRRRSSKEGER